MDNKYWSTDEEAKKKWQAVQDRDGYPDPETGISGHCPICHGVYPHATCGHTAGCPEC
jgi:hypothetical protein